MTGEMFGGLRHRNMKAKGRAIGWIQITASRDYPVEGAQCTCAAVNSVREIMKFITTNTLTGPAYLEMLKKSLRVENGRNLRDTKCLAIREDRS